MWAGMGMFILSTYTGIPDKRGKERSKQGRLIGVMVALLVRVFMLAFLSICTIPLRLQASPTHLLEYKNFPVLTVVTYRIPGVASASHNEPCTQLIATITIPTEIRPIVLPESAYGRL